MAKAIKRSVPTGPFIHDDDDCNCEPFVDSESAARLDMKWRLARYEAPVAHVLKKTMLPAEAKAVYRAYVLDEESLKLSRFMIKEGVPQVHVSSIKRAMRVVVCFSLLTSHLLIVLSYYNSASLLFWNWRKLFVIACLCETCILFPVVFYAGFTAGNPMEYVLKYLETQKSKRSRLPERSSVEDRTGVACIAVVAVLALLFVALMMYMKMRESHEVGLNLPNRWKLYDMHGNVDEGCLNWNSPLWYGKDPRGFPVGSDRMRRGGNWWIS